MSEDELVQVEGVFNISLTFRTDPWELTIDGNVANGDMALAMLDQARRKVEQDMRIAAGIQATMEMKKKVEDETRVARLLGRNRTQ